MKTLITLMILFSPLASYSTSFEDQHKKVITEIIKAADFVKIPREILLAICYGESNFRTKGVSHIDGGSISHGACQVKLAAANFMDAYYRHKIIATPAVLENIYMNAFYAAKLVKYQLERYDDNWRLAVDAYNKGTAYSGNTSYVKKFIKHLKFIRSNVSGVLVYVKVD